MRLRRMAAVAALTAALLCWGPRGSILEWGPTILVATGDLFTSSFGSASPYGFSAGEFRTSGDTYVTLAQNLGTGPGSRDFIRSTNQVTAVAGQFYAGWATAVTAPSTDASRFVRIYLRVGSGFDATGVTDPWTDKWIMLGDQGSSADGDRVIAVLGPRIGLTDCQLRVGRNVGDFGTGDATEDINLTLGSWRSIQFEVRGGSSPYIKVWVDNDTYASPTKSLSGTGGLSGWSSAGWDSAELGFFHNDRTATGGNVVLDYSQFEVATTFDSSFHANQGTGGGGGGSSGIIGGIKTIPAFIRRP